MNLPQAIEILADSAYRGTTTLDQDFKDAEKLGIEAMKRFLQLRAYTSSLFLALLPGETLE